MTKRIAVIGAGAAGLCAAKHLKAKGMEVVIYEIGSHVGGLWVYENDNGLSPAYLSLHVNSETRVTEYKDFAFPEGSPLYPDHRGMTAYLRAYAEQFRLFPLIRFNSRVTKVTKTGDRWTVTAEGAEAETYHGVVVGSGHQSVPRHPPVAGDFTGEYLHAHSYRVPEPVRGKDVLVVGIGNSACDIAADICTHTGSVTMAARSPVLLMPRMFLGVPTSRVLGKLEKRWMPWPLRRWIRTAIARMAHGTMEQWGFVTPKTRTHPAGHHLLIGHFIWNRITAKPGIRSVSGREVTFVDGTARSFDTIIAATGYEVETPFLGPEHDPMDGCWPDLFNRVVKPGVPGLYFVGFFNVSGGGNVRMMDDQAEWVAAIESGAAVLPTPDAMRASITAERAKLEKIYPESPRYGLELDPAEYRTALAQEMKRGARSA
jgi:dimethylaniline monooxygenase (N-oxide forming)